MTRKIIINNKEFKMKKISVDEYMDYLEIAESMDGHTRYTKQDIETMMLFICKAYDNQFAVEELKDAEKGLDAAGIIMEFMLIDASIGLQIENKLKSMEKNF